MQLRWSNILDLLPKFSRGVFKGWEGFSFFHFTSARPF